MCGGGEEKRKAGEVHGWWIGGKKEKKKRIGEWGVRFTCMVGKKEEWKRKKKKKFEGKKIKLVLFVCSLCLMQSLEL